jgi:hypothetical protein
MIKLKDIIKEISEAILSNYGYPCWWVDKSGKIIPCDYHLKGAKDILGNNALNKDQTEIYDLMYKRGYIRLMKNDSGELYISYEPKISLPSNAQLEDVKEFAFEKGLRLFDENRNRYLVR